MQIEHPPKLFFNTERFSYEREQILNNRVLGMRVKLIKTNCGWSVPLDQLIGTIIDYNPAHGNYYLEFDHPDLYCDYRYIYCHLWSELEVLKDQSPKESRQRHSYPSIRFEDRPLHRLGLLFKTYNEPNINHERETSKNRVVSS